ncbi:MAG: sulfatase-like hydrolase/transferase, partial [Myxococcales bacterium]|nr:sulfatase-like hydrolase/transferase [Myxococcales bacterium]
MRSTISLVAVLAILALSACNRIGAHEGPSAAGPSVLLVSIDTLREDRVGAYGASFGATPHLDALAAAGVRVEKAIAPTPLTLPSHATLLTGLYPPHHGVRHNGIFRLESESITLAERFQEAGWATGAVVGAVVLAGRYGLDQGFDSYDDAFESAQASATGYPERSATEVTRAALDWLARQSPEQPFFLWVHYYDPHADYRAPEPFASSFPELPYEAEVAYVDSALGKLVAGLRDSGRLEETVVAVTSDHGESLGEHGERTHSYGLYDATLAVPWVLRGPGLPAGETVPGVVSLASLAPTVLELAGLDALPRTDAPSLVGAWAKPESGEGAYAESLATRLDHGWAALHAWRTSDHHYVRAPRAELYDVSVDPREREDLLAAPTRSPDAAGIAASLDARIAAVLEDERALRRAPIDSAALEQLRALGYAVRPDEAEETGIDPKDGLRSVEVYVEARSAFFQGRLEEARAKAEALLAEHPRSGQAHMLLSGIAQRNGNVQGALDHAEQAASLLPESAPFQAQLADLRLGTGDVAGAVRAYDAALAIDPGFAAAHVGAMWRLRVGGTLDQATGSAERALELGADEPWLRLRLAETWDRLGVADRALAAYLDVLDREPANEVAHVGAAIQLVRVGRPTEIGPHLEAAGTLANDPNVRNRLAIAFAGRGDSARAETLLRALLAEYPEHTSVRRNLAHLLRTNGQSEEAARLE